MVDFLFPDVGEGIHEGKLIEWRIKEGDTVKQDQVLCTIETDKAVVEIPSPQSGVVTKLHHAAGTVLKVGEPLVTFGASDGTPAQVQKPAFANTPAPQQPSSEFKRPIESGTGKVESNLVPNLPTTHEGISAITQPVISQFADLYNQQGPSTECFTHVLAMPRTRKLAREKGVDIQCIRGTGPNGRITDDDVTAAANATASTRTPTATPVASTATNPSLQQSITNTASATTPRLPGSTIPYSGRRKAIGEHMVAGHSIPTVTMFGRADVTTLMQTREHLKPHAEHVGVKLTPLAFFVKGTCTALKEHPIFNSTFAGDSITLISNEHIGIAVDTPKGLVVPVVKNAETLSILEIAKQVQTIAEAARTNTLKPEQVRGSTFTISSVGAGRVEGFTQILNTPEEAILGIGGIQDEARFIDGKVVARKIVTISLTFDHRIADGADGARFLTTLITILEDPELMLLGGA